MDFLKDLSETEVTVEQIMELTDTMNNQKSPGTYAIDPVNELMDEITKLL